MSAFTRFPSSSIVLLMTPSIGERILVYSTMTRLLRASASETPTAAFASS